MKFSIITATFNAGDSLRRTLDSVLNQSYDASKIEMVIIDGGSTDHTVDIIKEYEIKFVGRLQWVSEKDDGIYHAFNKGIKMAKHEIINFQGAGDWLELGALEQIARAYAQESEVEVVHGVRAIWKTDDNNKIIKESVLLFPHELIWHNFNPVHQAAFYKKELHDRYGYYSQDYRIAGDLAFFLKLSVHSTVRINRKIVHTSNFMLGGTSSDDVLTAQEIEWVMQEWLRDNDFSELQRENVLTLVCMRGVMWRFFTPWSFRHWAELSSGEKTEIIKEYQDYVKNHGITKELVNQWATVWFMDVFSPSVDAVVRAGTWIEQINATTDLNELLAIFDSYAPVTVSSWKKFMKKGIKALLPYGVVLWIQKRKGMR